MAKKRKIKKSRVAILMAIACVLMAVVISLVVYLFVSITGQKTLTACAYEPTSRKLDIPIHANNYIVIKNDKDKLKVLYADGEHDKIYPASLTKIMTMMVTLDYTSDIDEELVVSQEDLDGLIEANASVYGLEVGDAITIKEALFGLILESGADCANILKRYVEQKGVDFVSEMNEKAQAIGMKDTHFANVTGLDDTQNYTTVYDLGLLLREAFKNDNAKEILSSMEYTSDDHGYHFEATMSDLADLDIANAKVLGGKTGFTYIAHLTIASVVENDYGEIYFIILADADENTQDGRAAHMVDVKDILETYFARW